MKIAINGFGRIGRTFLRALLLDECARKSLDVVAINIGPADKLLAGYLFKYDTVMGTFQGHVQVLDDVLIVNDKKIKLYASPDAFNLPWSSLAIDWVVDCSGKYTERERALEHIKAGAKKVLISAPSKGEDVTIIPGINDAAYENNVTIVSLGSCTTNAFVPMLKILNDEFTITNGFMTTIHAYTNTQALLDVDIGDARRSRAAALNIVPTTSGATSTLQKVLPELIGKIDGCALRVPVAKVSLVDLTFYTEKLLSIKHINDLFIQAKNGLYKNIVDITFEPLVSSDFSGNSHSVIIDGSLTQVVGRMGKVFGWYDNEWGYSERLKDFLMNVAKCNN